MEKNMSNTKRTPLPWHVTVERNSTVFIDGADERVAFAFPGFQHANAAFIVRAVNAHDKLIDALRQGRVAIDVLMAQLIEVDPSFKPTQSAAWPALVAIKAALEKVED
jgi:hypothetical protein